MEQVEQRSALDLKAGRHLLDHEWDFEGGQSIRDGFSGRHWIESELGDGKGTEAVEGDTFET